MGSSDVVNVWAWVTVGVAAPCWCSENGVCVCLTSEVGVAALCGCVSCGLCVPLMWSMCGHGVYWPGTRWKALRGVCV